jgi:hypothetical protein
MKRLFYIISALLLISWVSIFFGFHIGHAFHSLALLSVIFCLQGIIHVTPKKISEAETTTARQ